MKMQWYRLFVRDVLSQKWTEMPDWLFRRFIQFQAIAADYGEDGLLPPVSDMAWSLRPVKETSLSEALVALSKVGEAEETPEGWRLTHFRPVGDSYERVRKHRDKQKRDETERNGAAAGETSSLLLSSSSDSLSEGERVQGEGGPPTTADAGSRAAQILLLEVSQLAALPPSEVARVEQVAAMTARYGAGATRQELIAQRARWLETHGRHGRRYSPLNFGWVEWADAVLSGADPGEDPDPPPGDDTEYDEIMRNAAPPPPEIAEKLERLEAEWRKHRGSG